jgi:deoxyadenosine/deoxycytidine kinase
MSKYDQGKLLIIDSDELDFVKNPSDFDGIAKQILAKIDQTDLFLPISGKTTQEAGSRVLN